MTRLAGVTDDFELIRDALLRLGPETRSETIEAMKVFRTLPRPVAVRVLLDESRRATLHASSSLLAPLI
jgi:hypothetical protein